MNQITLVVLSRYFQTETRYLLRREYPQKCLRIKENADRENSVPEQNVLIRCQRFHVERIRRTVGNHVDVREVIRHIGSVVLLPIIDDDHLCLIRNYRVALGRELIELPAGTREPNESPEVTARRELIEETGYRCERLERVMEFYPAPGILDEQMILYRAEGLTAGEPAREPGEQIENLVVNREKVQELLQGGGICDAKSIIGAMLWLGESS